LKSSKIISLDDEPYSLVAYALTSYAARPGDSAHGTVLGVGITVGANMTYLKDHLYGWHVLVGIILAMMLFGCSPLPRQGAGPEPPVVPAEPNEAAAQSEKITLSLEFEPGTKTRYRVTTEAVTAMEGPETAVRDNASTAPFPKVSESSEVVFTQEILGTVPEDTNAVVALVTIEQARYVRTSTGQPDLAFDSQEPADQNSPFAKLIGQTYTIEISPLGYVPGVFNLRPARLAVRGPPRPMLPPSTW
jgi:hypothetical protein